MKRLKIIIFTIFISFITACGGGTYFPGDIWIDVTIVDQVSNPITGLQCILLKNSEESRMRITDSKGFCTLKTIQDYDYRYMSSDDFFKMLTIVIEDIDDSENGGLFITKEYQLQSFEDRVLTLTLELAK